MAKRDLRDRSNSRLVRLSSDVVATAERVMKATRREYTFAGFIAELVRERERELRGERGPTLDLGVNPKLRK